MSDSLTQVLESLTGELPQPRLNISDQEKDALIAKIGIRTVKSIVQAKKELPLRRIPFLFSTIDTQAVVDLLANDMTAAINRVKQRGNV